jgi:hypothetical protein
MAIPKNLKIGGTFTENDFKGPLLYKVIGFDGAGNYISEYIGRAEKKVEEPEVEEEITEEVVKDYEITEETVTPIEQLLAEEAPKKVLAKKPATRKAPAKRKRTPAKKA